MAALSEWSRRWKHGGEGRGPGDPGGASEVRGKPTRSTLSPTAAGEEVALRKQLGQQEHTGTSAPPYPLP